MTIKKKWECRLPILRIGITRAKTLREGYEEKVWRYQGYDPDEWKMGVRIPETFTVLTPDSIKVQNEWPYETGKLPSQVLERKAITNWSRDGQMRSYEAILHEGKIFTIEWEPSSSSKERE